MNKNTAHILIVDDNRFNLEIASEFLKQKGHETLLSLNGYHALKTLEENRICLILLDIMMPGIDGFEVCMKIKANPETRDIPIIFLTAKTETEDIVKGFNLGASDYIVKPFRKEELCARVNTHLKLYRANNIIKKQVAELEGLNKKYTDSILYAKSIQQEILPPPFILNKTFPENFIISHPKDVLSGDFFKIFEIEELVVVILADCTGHGVPGALISIMSITLLNQIPLGIVKSNPSLVLEYMRTNIKKTLNQKSLEDNITDGLDMCVLKIDRKNMTAKFAGANIGLHKISDNSEQIEIVEPDNMPVSVWFKERPFRNNTVNIQKNDKFYIFTDGVTDLFDNSQNEKLGKKRLLSIMLNTCKSEFNEQENFIDKEIDKWKGDTEQIDDITIIGFKI